MKQWILRRFALVLVLLLWAGSGVQAADSPEQRTIVYTLSVPAPESHYTEVEALIPLDAGASVDLMMPVWSPGYYVVEDYASRIEDFHAQTPEGVSLAVEKTQSNRWRVQTDGVPTLVVSYRVLCNGRSVTGSYVGQDYAIWNGTSTFVTTTEENSLNYQVRVTLAPGWTRVLSGLESVGPTVLVAENYDVLVDCPIFAGDPVVTAFEVAGIRHEMVDVGELGPWDSRASAEDYRKIVQENERFWGVLPYKKYVFFNLFRRGAGGLEHNNSCFLNLGPGRSARPGYSAMTFVSHEYFHLFNVKRLRPIELGPFDYETPPRTSGLWVAVGMTTYYGNLLATRAGFGEPLDFLAALSEDIAQLQNCAGRHVQSLTQASQEVFSSGFSGLWGSDTTISYYVKGNVVAFLLDARIRHATEGKKCLDDLMRLAFQRYGGESGFTEAQFQEAAEEVAGVDLDEWFRKAVLSTEELDYTEALEWFGLRFNTQDPSRAWMLERREDASKASRNHLKRFLGRRPE